MLFFFFLLPFFVKLFVQRSAVSLVPVREWRFIRTVCFIIIIQKGRETRVCYVTLNY